MNQSSSALNDLAKVVSKIFSQAIFFELIDPIIGSLTPLLNKYHGIAKAELAYKLLRNNSNIVTYDVKNIVAIMENISIPMNTDQLASYFVWLLTNRPPNVLAKIQKNRPRTLKGFLS